MNSVVFKNVYAAYVMLQQCTSKCSTEGATVQNSKVPQYTKLSYNAFLYAPLSPLFILCYEYHQNRPIGSDSSLPLLGTRFGCRWPICGETIKGYLEEGMPHYSRRLLLRLPRLSLHRALNVQNGGSQNAIVPYGRTKTPHDLSNTVRYCSPLL